MVADDALCRLRRVANSCTKDIADMAVTDLRSWQYLKGNFADYFKGLEFAAKHIF